MGIFTVSEKKIIYNDISLSNADYTEKMDEYYNKLAKFYNLFITIIPAWKRWIRSVLSYISGPDVLEVSFGSGYLLSKYAGKYKCSGIDFNSEMIRVTGKKLKKHKLSAELLQGNVESLPYGNESFDSVVNTMALTGYPDGEIAVAEMLRVLKPGGKLLLVDFDFPENRNRCGYNLTKIMQNSGDVIKDIPGLLMKFSNNCSFIKKVVGGFGSVFLYIIEKRGLK